MTLKEKLDKIRNPKLEKLDDGSCNSVKELWDTIISKFLPSEDTIRGFHKLLIDYVNSKNPVLVIRAFNSADKKNYGKLRRGFYNKVSDVSFFYTDNFFTAYFAKMAIDGYVPTLAEFTEMMQNRTFPARFGPDCAAERKLMAYHKGKNVGITEAGYKIAHILATGEDYLLDGELLKISDICRRYFPRGERSEWTLHHDQFGDFYQRELPDNPVARKLLTAIFLRVTHPINYFLVPKTTAEINDKNPTKGIGEYEELIKYAHNYFLDKYPDIYKEYLDYVLPSDDFTIDLPVAQDLKIQYGIGINPKNKTKKTSSTKVDSEKKEVVSPDESRRRVQKFAEDYLANRKAAPTTFDHQTCLKVAKEFLSNPKTSTRTLEQTILGLPYKVRGGGYKAQTILKKLGLPNSHKGILSKTSIDDLIKSSSGRIKNTLIEVKTTFNL